MSKPVGFSNSSAGPPPGDLDTVSVTAQISRSGLTGSPMRASSRSFSSASMNSVRSFISSTRDLKVAPTGSNGLHLVRDRLGQGQGAAAVLAGHHRRALLADGAHEILELALERLFPRDRQLPSLDLGALPFATLQAIALDRLFRVVDRDVGVGLEEADLPHALAADAAGGHV